METEPFPHVVIDDAFDAGLVAAAGRSIPPAGWPGWVRYQSAHEQGKRTTRDLHKLDGDACRLFWLLHSPTWIEQVRARFGLGELFPDPLLHGGGIHVTDPGGFLDVHIDYALHPVLDAERAVNLILFLNRDWHSDWGGCLEFYADDGATVAKSIEPRFNRVVLWRPSDVAYHGMPTPLRCPEGVSRVSAATYYLTRKSGPHVVRKRALFVPRRSA